MEEAFHLEAGFVAANLAQDEHATTPLRDDTFWLDANGNSFLITWLSAPLFGAAPFPDCVSNVATDDCRRVLTTSKGQVKTAPAVPPNLKSHKQIEDYTLFSKIDWISNFINKLNLI